MPEEKKKVLFVDDETFICSMAADFLQMEGYDVETYDDGRDAYEAFRCAPQKYDIVVSDQSMTGLTGIELLRDIGMIRSGIPKILCTGSYENLGPMETNEVVIDAFFIKPYRFDELIGQIEKLVRSEGYERQQSDNSDN